MSKALSWIALIGFTFIAAVAVLLHWTGTPTRKPATPLSPDPAPLVQYDVVAEYPHDPKALTQGLIFNSGFLYESTGLHGQSSVRKVELATGRVIQERALDNGLVGGGLTEWDGQIIQMTSLRTKPKGIFENLGHNWRGDSGVRYDVESLDAKSTFSHNGDVWGLTHNDREIIKSDGTSILRSLNPDTMKWQSQIEVIEAGKGIRWLNELEMVNGEVWANIWQQNRIAIIRPDSGQVTGWLDLSGLLPRMNPPPQDVQGLGAYGKAVANGIAYDAQARRVFVTGKNWPRLFEIRLKN